MLVTYFLTALAAIIRQPVFFAIKILGLTIGLVCSMLVLLHVQYATSSNKHIQSWESSVQSSRRRDRRILFSGRTGCD